MHVHLHNHSDYSLLDGACRIPELIKIAALQGSPAVGLTDHGNLFGALDFYTKAREAGIKPILGCELYLAPESRHIKKPGRAGELRYHQVLLAKNYTGYRNLSYLVSEAYTSGFYYKPRIDRELLTAHHEGLICLSSCMQGAIPQAILDRKDDEAVELIKWYRDLFGQDFYLELMRHGIEEEDILVPALSQFAVDFDLKVVATNDAHYLKREHASAHDILLCVGTQAKRDDPSRLRFATPEFYLKSEAEMRALFSDLPDAVDMTVEIAGKVDLEIPLDVRHYPVFQIPTSVSSVTPLRVTEGTGDGTVNHGGLTVEKTKASVTPLRVTEMTGDGTVNHGGLTEEKTKASITPLRVTEMTGDGTVNHGGLTEEKTKASITPLRLTEENSHVDEYLERKTTEGFLMRYGTEPSEEAWRRLRHELEVIKETGFSNYFLIVWDFVRWAKDHGIPVGPGRGSAAGCIVSYCLGITNLDPIRYGLIFERFLNPERVSPPDIDIDFSDDRREEVISYVREKYGADSVCRITTFGKMAAKSAIRDVARAMGMSYGEADRMAKLIPDGGKDINLERAVKEVPEIQALIDSDPRYKELIELARIVEGAVRHSSVHAAGVVICPGPVVDYLPVYKPSGDETDLYTQYDMTWMDGLGLLKMDFLGLQTLQELDLTLKSLSRKGIEIDLNNIPLDDPRIFQLFSEGRMTGIFQFESGGMRDNLMKLKPERLEDLIAMNALYRPGPMQMIDEFINCRHGRKKVEYSHPKLEPILKETYGVIVYQEQVIRIACDLAGFSLGKADNLRKAMGKKKMDIMMKYRQEFIDGCVSNSIDTKIAESIFDICQEFAKYSFVKAHSAGYALIAYQCAYLKVYHPADFMAACMTVRRRDTNQVLKLLAECRAMGEKILPPDINESQSPFIATDKGIRFGLTAVKNVGGAAVNSLIEARSSVERFSSFFHFLSTIDARTVNKKVLESLIDGGAFDSFGINRATLLNSLGGAMAYSQATQDERDRGQNSLFGGGDSQNAPVFSPPELHFLPEWPMPELLSREKTVLGYYISSHPLERFSREIEGLSTHRLADKDEFTDGMQIKVCGVITSVSKKLTKNGDRWATILFEDLTGPIECLIFQQSYQQFEAMLQTDKLVAISGKVSRGDEAEDPKLRVDEVTDIEKAAEKWGQSVRLRLPSERVSEPLLQRLEKLFEDNPGNCAIYFDLEYSGGEHKTLKIPRFKIKAAPEMISRLSELVGADRVMVGR